MKHLLQLLIIIFVLSVNLLAQKQFEMEIVTNKDTFIVGEKVDIGLKLKNITDFTQEIISYSTIDILIYDEKGKEIEQKIGPMGEPHCFGIGKAELKSGESGYKIYDLSYLFGTLTFYGISDKFFTAGHYTCKVVIKSANGYTEQRTLQFTVVAPTGEELKFYNKLNDIMPLFSIYTYESTKTGVEKLEALHNEYPNSVYSPTLLDYLAAVIGFGPIQDKVKASKLRDYMIEDYTWACVNRGYLMIRLGEKAAKAEKINYLKRLLPKSGNGTVNKFIEYLLNEEINK